MTYQELTAYIDSLREPSENELLGAKKISTGAKHALNKSTDHNLNDYELLLHNQDGVKVFYRYNYCPTCREIRNAWMVGFKNNSYYLRDFIRHGERITY